MLLFLAGHCRHPFNPVSVGWLSRSRSCMVPKKSTLYGITYPRFAHHLLSGRLFITGIYSLECYFPVSLTAREKRKRIPNMRKGPRSQEPKSTTEIRGSACIQSPGSNSNNCYVFYYYYYFLTTGGSFFFFFFFFSNDYCIVFFDI